MHKVIIAVPSYDGAIDIRAAAQMLRLGAQPSPDISLGLITQTGSKLPGIRNELVTEFLKIPEATALLFLDADVVFRAEDLIRLIRWTEEADVEMVCGAYRQKSDETKYILRLFENRIVHNLSGGLIRITNIGCGFNLITRKVFEKIIEDNPRFFYKERGREIRHFFEFKFVETDALYGEDYTFCDLVTKSGFKIWVDPMMTLTHVGKHDFTGTLADIFGGPNEQLPDQKERQVAPDGDGQ